VKENAKTRQKVPWTFAKFYINSNDRILWAQKSSVNTAQIVQSCTLFSKAQVCHSRSKIPNAGHALVPSRQVSPQSLLV